MTTLSFLIIKSSRQPVNCPLQRSAYKTAPDTIVPPGVPFGPVHFTEYLPNPAYSEFDLETILIADHLARTRETKYIERKGKRYKVPPLLFEDKYNYLPAYFFPMTPPLSPRPDRPMKPIAKEETTSIQLFGDWWILWSLTLTLVLTQHPFYGGLYLPTWLHPVPSRVMPLPIPDFLTPFPLPDSHCYHRSNEEDAFSSAPSASTLEFT
ncbi:hypothetical protein DSO57_1020258 [Entomophthora muscae]|uniref:Uncharacterized protein n=1 Tax=Entomophthora muscae TaxID=34485 RepID=A0ACC2UPY2_9FUNG|nr:hypothetical protein DSO57_1020258 [Entomophthora muscae]